MSLAVQQFPLEEEYKKHCNIPRADVSKLRAWLHTQLHLPGEHITDLDLILAYHSCDRSMELTKRVVDLHFTIKTHSKLFKNRHLFDNTYDNLKTIVVYQLEAPAYDGSICLYAALVNTDYKIFNFCESVRSVVAVLDLLQFEQGTWRGVHLLLDMTNFSLAHVARIDLHTLQQLFYFLQEALLVRMRGLHFLNAPSFMDKVLFLIRPFMKQQLLSIMNVHLPGLRSLGAHLPVEALPADAGGEGPTRRDASAHMLQKVKDNRPFFEMEMKKRVDESRRPGKPRTVSDVFGGVEGSFKTLEID